MPFDQESSDLTLVIPAFNEAQRLPKTLTDVKSFLDSWGINYRVIVADDGSSDGTALLTNHFGERFSTLTRPHAGKGSAVRGGMLVAKGRVVAFTDADLPFDLKALQIAYQMIDDMHCNVVFGSRIATGSVSCVRRRWMRTLASTVFRCFMWLLVSRRISDTQCGLKVFSRTAAQAIFSRTKVDGFAFDAEVVYLTHWLNLKFDTVPVILVNEYSTTISLTRNALRMLLDVVGVRIRSACGGYSLK